ncbi:MAG: hypothetical protein IKE66_08110 [Hyphomicrobium sp.]|nr:hypothetical protein [Hyphomicrobium sp.]
MSRRFQVLLDRYAIIRREIDAERDQPCPNELRLVRLKSLQLLINTRIREFVEARAIRRASAPRYRPSYAFASTAPRRALNLIAH